MGTSDLCQEVRSTGDPPGLVTGVCSGGAEGGLWD